MFVACHPVLSMAARTALTLRLVGGLSTAEIARAYLQPETTIAQRIVRAKKSIAAAGVPFEVPEGSERATRLGCGARGDLPHLQRGVLRDRRTPTGRAPSSATRRLRLGRHARRGSRPTSPRSTGSSRSWSCRRRASPRDSGHRARPCCSPIRTGGGGTGSTSTSGSPRWRVPRSCSPRSGRTRCKRRSPRATAGRRASRTPTGSRSSTSTARSRARRRRRSSSSTGPSRCRWRTGPAAALELVDALAATGTLDRYHLLHAVRGDLLAKLSRHEDAAAAFERAASLAGNDAERALSEDRARASAALA